MLHRACLLMLLLACSGPAHVDPSDVRAASVRLDVALDRAVDLHAAGRTADAQQAWREAHLVWERSIGPGLEKRLGATEVIALELHLARIRAALDAPDGDAAAEVERFRQALQSPIAALPPPPGS